MLAGEIFQHGISIGSSNNGLLVFQMPYQRPPASAI